MTDQERKEIIAEVTAILEEKYKNENMKDNLKVALSVPRKKWFRDVNGKHSQDTLMDMAFSGTNVKVWSVWDTIRRLTCYACGERYVKRLDFIEKADEICDRICELVYNIRMEAKNSDSEVPEPKD